jgi:hypothetical protein
MNTLFRMNQICFDKEAKELVKITNGIERKVSDFKNEFCPTEAIVIRVFPPKPGSKKPQIAYTYRKVNPEFLIPQKMSETAKLDSFDYYLIQNTSDDGFEFIGRI